MFKKILGKKKFVFECLNAARHLKKLTDKKIDIYDLKKINDKTISFCAFAKDSTEIKKEFKNAHMLKEENKTGFLLFLSFFRKNLAVFLSFLICFASFPVFNAFVWNVNVFTFDANVENSIKEYLLENNIKAGRIKSSYNTAGIKSLLLENFSSIAFVDVEIKHETLIVNVREKLYSKTEFLQGSPLLAQFDGIVELVDIKSGTAKVKEGDVVRAGEVLVEAYMKRENDFIPCEVEGAIQVRSFKQFEIEFSEKNTVFVRSGRKVVKNYFTFFKDFDKIKLDKSGFQNFEVQVICSNEKLFPIIPLKLTSVCFYELEEQEVFTDFEANKQEILDNFRKERVDEIDPEKIFAEEIFSEKIQEGKYKITYYVDFLKTY